MNIVNGPVAARTPYHANPDALCVVGDIGGTNARFAIADWSGPARATVSREFTYRTAEFEDLAAALKAYLAEASPQMKPTWAAIAVAGPVLDGEARLTNGGWCASERALREAGFIRAHLFNDYQALAASADLLGDEDLSALGPSARRRGESIAIVGAGTGLGVSALMRVSGKSIVVVGEGGHAGFAPASAREVEVLAQLKRRFGRVSAERVLSGPGLVNLHGALCETAGEEAVHESPTSIVAEALRGPGLCRDAVECLCEILGSFAGDVALTFAARGGVLIAGGLARAIEPFLNGVGFRRRFEDKGRLSHMTRAIPTHLILRANAALLGCAAIARDLAGREASS
jgi:glucokinase